MASYRDVAKRAGVSEMTVSRVLRGKSGVSGATRAAVHSAAESLGYHHNPLVQSLMRQVRERRVSTDPHHVAWLYPDVDRQNAGVFALYRQGAEARASELGMRIDEFTLKDDLTPKRLREILLARGITSVIVNPSSEHEQELDPTFFEGFASVTFGYTVTRPDLERITSHHSRNQYRLLTTLVQKGFRDILYISTPVEEERVNFGWMAATLAFGKKESGRMRVRHVFSDVFLRSLERRGRAVLPEVLVIGTRTVIEQLRTRGIAIPGDLSIASTTVEIHDDLPIAGMDQCSADIGRRAVDVLFEHILSNRRGILPHPSCTLMDGDWVDGETLRSP